MSWKGRSGLWWGRQTPPRVLQHNTGSLLRGCTGKYFLSSHLCTAGFLVLLGILYSVFSARNNRYETLESIRKALYSESQEPQPYTYPQILTVGILIMRKFLVEVV